jgi:hypothetical protein
MLPFRLFEPCCLIFTAALSYPSDFITSDTLADAGALSAIAVDPTGEWIAASSVGTVSVYRRGQMSRAAVGVVSKEAVTRLSFSPDSRYVLVLPAMRLLEVGTGKVSDVVSCTANPEGAGGVSNRAELIATSTHDRAVEVCSPEDGRRGLRLSGHQSTIQAISFSPVARVAVTGEYTGESHVWDLLTGCEQWQLTPHTNYVRTAQFSANGQWIVTVADNALHVSDVRNGQLMLKLDPPSGTFIAGAVATDGRVVAIVQDPAFRVISTGSIPQLVQRHSRAFLHVLAVGANYSISSGARLQYAESDARAVAHALAAAGNPNRRPSVTTLTGQCATSSNVIKAMSRMAEAVSEDDIAFVYLAAHGERSADGVHVALPDRLYSDGDLTDGLARIRCGRQLIVLDVCGSGAAARTIVQKLSRLENGTDAAVQVLAAASDEAVELSVTGHGALTQALLQELAEKDRVRVSALMKAVSQRASAIASAHDRMLRQKPVNAGRKDFVLWLRPEETKQ